MTLDTVYVVKNLAESSPSPLLSIFINFGLISCLGVFIAFYFNGKIEKLKNEYAIIQAAFTHTYEIITGFYKTFYWHFIRCQNVTLNATDPVSSVSELQFMNELNSFKSQWHVYEAIINLVTPDEIRKIYDRAENAFNDFNDILPVYFTNGIISSPKPTADLQNKFKVIETIKIDFDIAIRKLLRTNKLFQS